MKYWGFLFLLISINAMTFGQCFTIESVLADACGDPEGENEMVTLRVNENLDIKEYSESSNTVKFDKKDLIRLSFLGILSN